MKVKHEPRGRSRTVSVAGAILAVLLSVALAVLLSKLVTLGTSSLLLAAGGLVVLAAILVLGLPLLERLPAPRPRPSARRVTPSPRPVRQPLTR